MTAHPLLFAVLPILMLYSRNAGQLSPGELWLPVLLALVASAALWLLVGRLLRDRERAALVVSLFWVLFFSYGHLWALVQRVSLLSALLPEPVEFAIAYAGLGGLGIAATVVKGRRWAAASGVLNLVAAALVGFQLLSTGAYEVKRWQAGRRQPEVGLVAGGRAAAYRANPNIYYIILDAYGREDILKERFGLENREFVGYLERKGFHVARRATSNYCQTLLSVASCLNLDYVDRLATHLGPDSDDRSPLQRQIAQSRLWRFLRQRGYREVAFASGYGGTELKGADVYLGPRSGLSLFQGALLDTTPLSSGFVSRLLAGGGSDLHAQTVLYALRELPKTTRFEGPIFVFAHIVAPHPPFVFARNGRVSHAAAGFSDGSDYPGSREEYIRGYREQLLFINREVRASLDQLLANTPRPTVIVLQADHGPGSRLDWSSAEKTDVRERFAPLSACYLPAGADASWEDDCSAVNTFRRVLNACFGTALPMLPTRNYFSTWSRPYRFTDVTARVQERPRPRTAPVPPPSARPPGGASHRL